MKLMMTVLALALTLSATTEANAASLFYDTCGNAAHSELLQGNEGPYVLVALKSGFAGMTCQDLKQAFDAANVIGVTLMPASLVLKTPGVKEELVTELAELGLTLANPAVLGVTVIGAIGVTTVYLVMRQSVKDCEQLEKQQLKQDILNQLKSTYGVKAGQNVDFKIDEGDAA